MGWYKGVCWYKSRLQSASVEMCRIHSPLLANSTTYVSSDHDMFEWEFTIYSIITLTSFDMIVTLYKNIRKLDS
jgi:hypothetical protein